MKIKKIIKKYKFVRNYLLTYWKIYARILNVTAYISNNLRKETLNNGTFKQTENG